MWLTHLEITSAVLCLSYVFLSRFRLVLHHKCNHFMQHTNLLLFGNIIFVLLIQQLFIWKKGVVKNIILYNSLNNVQSAGLTSVLSQDQLTTVGRDRAGDSLQLEVRCRENLSRFLRLPAPLPRTHSLGTHSGYLRRACAQEFFPPYQRPEELKELCGEKESKYLLTDRCV